MALLHFPARRDRYDAPVNPQVRSTISIVAIGCAIGSFFASGHGREFVGFFLALAAIVAGLLGGVRALSPRVSGGILSIAAVGLGLIAVIFAFICLFV